MEIKGDRYVNKHNVEVAVERGRARQKSDLGSTVSDMVGLEALINDVAEQVSGANGSGGGGLLHKVRAFNGFLERAARALEGLT